MPGRVLGMLDAAPADCGDDEPESDRTSRTGLAPAGRLIGEVVVAPENAWSELPEIMRRIVTRIRFE